MNIFILFPIRYTRLPGRALFFLLFLLYPISVPGQNATDSTRILQVERNILPAIVSADSARITRSISERLRFYGIPGVSVAVIEGGEIAWARGYGTADVATGRPVTTHTLFQAGSISKPVTAAAALSLVRQNHISLDTKVNDYLDSWSIPENRFTKEQSVTLRMLLSHTGGINIHGFGGYRQGTTVPTLVQVLNGTGPANSAPIRVQSVPGATWQYSGGGYTILQQLMIDLSKMSFPEVMNQHLLNPWEMDHSTFRQPLPDSLYNRAATGHYAGGERVKGRFHTYPEMAAAGLWTTPTDLARFIIGIQNAYRGEPSNVLNRPLAQEMLTPQKHNWGLGPRIQDTANHIRFRHGGVDHGFEALMVAYAREGYGAVIMANANLSQPLINELLDTIARVYQWPGHPPRSQFRYRPIDESHAEPYLGSYDWGDNQMMQVKHEGDRLLIHIPGQGEVGLYATKGNHTFFVPHFGMNITFERDSDGTVTSMQVAEVDQSWTAEKIR